jgi:putative tryptophan/tyrosine transport system substrate-binding protein
LSGFLSQGEERYKRGCWCPSGTAGAQVVDGPDWFEINGRPMRLNRFLVVLIVLALSIPAEAQQAKVYRVGVLGPPGKIEERREVKGLRDGLREAGYIEGKNLQLNIPNAKTYDEVRPIAKDYVEKRVDAIVTTSGTPTLIARDATKEIPIIFIWGVGDPIGSGLVKSLARPEGNITGLTFEAGDQMFAKRLELFKEAVPSLRRVALIYNAKGENPEHAIRLALVRETAPKLGLRLNVARWARANSNIINAQWC